MWPYWRSPPKGHVDASGAQCENTLLIEQQLVHRTLGRWVRAEGCIFLEVICIEGCNTALGNCQESRCDREWGLKRSSGSSVHIRFQPKGAPGLNRRRAR